MRPEISRRIERHLDEKLGLWTRLLPWRRELASHIEEAYYAAHCIEEATDSSVDEEQWQKALTDFGDIQAVESQMRKEHWSQYALLRFSVIIVSALVVFGVTGRGSSIYLSLPALGFVLGPTLAVLIFDFYRGSTRWERVNSIGTWGALCGALFAASVMITNMDDPSRIGAGLAGSILCSLYGILFFIPRRSFVLAFIGIVVFDICILITSFDASLSFEGFLYGSWKSLYGRFILRTLAYCCAGLTAGVARFGMRGIGKHAFSIGTGAFLISLIDMLCKLDSLRFVGPGLFTAFGSLLLATVTSQSICMASRIVRRRFS